MARSNLRRPRKHTPSDYRAAGIECLDWDRTLIRCGFCGAIWGLNGKGHRHWWMCPNRCNADADME